MEVNCTSETSKDDQVFLNRNRYRLQVQFINGIFHGERTRVVILCMYLIPEGMHCEMGV